VALQAENVRRVSRRGFGEPCQAELLPRRMYLTGTRWMPQGGSRNEENELDHSEILAAGPEAPSGESPLPGRDAGGFLHYRGPRHPPHPRPPWRLGSPRYPGPRSTSPLRAQEPVIPSAPTP
jgi:hypothetical protein